MEMNEDKPIGGVNEFLQGALKEPEEVCTVFESSKCRLEKLEESEKQCEKRLQICMQDLVKANEELREVESKLSPERFAGRLAEIKQTLKEAEQREAEAVAQKQAANNITEEIEVERRRIETQRKETQALIKSKFKSVRATCELYRSITGLEWNLKAEPHMCEGYIALENDTRPFSHNRNESSAFFIANYLWDLMDDDTRAECGS